MYMYFLLFYTTQHQLEMFAIIKIKHVKLFILIKWAQIHVLQRNEIKVLYCTLYYLQSKVTDSESSVPS